MKSKVAGHIREVERDENMWVIHLDASKLYNLSFNAHQAGTRKIIIQGRRGAGSTQVAIWGEGDENPQLNKDLGDDDKITVDSPGLDPHTSWLDPAGNQVDVSFTNGESSMSVSIHVVG